MIVIADSKRYALYARTNRRVRWTYAEYGGRYETIEAAIAAAKDHYTVKAEFIIEDEVEGETVATGFVNA